MKVKGSVIYVSPVKEGTSKNGNAWKSMDFVVECPERNSSYTHKICMNVFGEERINSLNIQVGTKATFRFDIDAHEYQGRWFNSINCYKVTSFDEPEDVPQNNTQNVQHVNPADNLQGGAAYQQSNQLYNPNGGVQFPGDLPFGQGSGAEPPY